MERLDSNGKTLSDGDTITIIKDLNIKGGGTIKQGTSVKKIRLCQDNNEEIIGRVDGEGTIHIRTEFVKINNKKKKKK